MLFSSQGQDSFPFDRIHSFRRQRGKVQVRLIGDGVNDFTDVPIEGFDHSIENTVQASFPAAPGTRTIVPVHEREGPDTYELDCEVLGFAIDPFGVVRAVTWEGVVEPLAVQFPDGHVEKFGDSPYESLDAFRQGMANLGT